METAVILTIIVAVASLFSVLGAALGRNVTTLTLFGFAGATVCSAFLVTISRADGPVLLIVPIILGISGVALIVTPAALLLWEKFEGRRVSRPDRAVEPKEYGSNP